MIKMMRKMKKIAIIMMTIAIGATLAEIFGLITTVQMVIINVISAVTMMIVLTISMYRFNKMMKTGIVPNFVEVKVIIPKASINDKHISANSEILKKNIIPTNPFRASIFRISMEINNSIEQLGISALRFRESKIIENTIKKRFVAKEIYVIDTIVGPDEVLNFKFDNDIDIKELLIDELYIP